MGVCNAISPATASRLASLGFVAWFGGPAARTAFLRFATVKNGWSPVNEAILGTPAIARSNFVETQQEYGLLAASCDLCSCSHLLPFRRGGEEEQVRRREPRRLGRSQVLHRRGPGGVPSVGISVPSIFDSANATLLPLRFSAPTCAIPGLPPGGNRPATGTTALTATACLGGVWDGSFTEGVDCPIPGLGWRPA
jgi:hypothetical protein